MDLVTASPTLLANSCKPQFMGWGATTYQCFEGSDRNSPTVSSPALRRHGRIFL
ncbi:hypothetical protein COO91_09532 (plasmid) [Nostoc flagelliforme CCNUN1]|uniref:Uncharacterized protein n=1 Tax=Nostoc flagelliforme CCNUN1 TaxID=2038116 RepID=A0A2K8T6N2_9NOSO|nr:hypothetical protein COO91_09532 [Nostoc flagelliforme CCNUN1]